MTIRRTSRALKTMALSGGLLACGAAVADAPNNVVQVSSLTVKERLHSIEQINVTAEKAPLPVAPLTSQVARLLEEADALDAAQPTPAVPASDD